MKKQKLRPRTLAPGSMGTMKNKAPRNRRTKIPLPIDKLVEEYLSGATAKQLGKKYGVSWMTILRRLKSKGIRIRTNSDRKISLPVGQIALDYLYGTSMSKLARLHGVDMNTIKSRLKEIGVHGKKR